MKIPQSDAEKQLQQNSDQHENGGSSSNGFHGEEESVIQQHEATMFGAIDQFCNAPEQTYEQFLEGFSYFRPEPMEKSLGGAAFNQSGLHSEVSQERNSVRSSEGDILCHVTPASSNHGNESDNEDLIEERIMETSSSLPTSSDNHEMKDRPMLKMDNFVDDESIPDDPDGDDDDVDEDYVPYVASFSGNNTALNVDLGTVGTTETDRDVSLVNIPDLDVLDDDGDPDEESQPMCDTDQQDRPPDRCPKSDVKGARKFEGAGQMIANHNSANLVESEHDDGTSSYDASKDTPYPGEIQDEAADSQRSTADVTHVRQMAYSAKMSDVIVIDPDVGDGRDESFFSNDVQPFSLDEDFDYDNVILTPKYSQLELAACKTAMDRETV